MFRSVNCNLLKVNLKRNYACFVTTCLDFKNDYITGPSKLFKALLFHRKEKMTTLETLNFDNMALRSLPIDPEKSNYVRQVPGACFSKVKPEPVVNPKVVAYSTSAMALLDLPESELSRSELAEYFSGNKTIPGSDTSAHCYCGHQFGHFSGQLGDGATMYIGEVVNSHGERWEIQFKGAGPTPYSRQADGRKVLRSSIREFLCSEAIHHLGIPTTRAGTCVTSDSTIIRDIFYNGNPIAEKITIILRIAPTFLRFGSFEIFKPTDSITGRKGPSVGRKDILLQMLDYSIKTFYSDIFHLHKNNKIEMYRNFFREVVLRTARLVSEWQCCGFCHGVLNTDNMSILGLTIDYGPFGFMDGYNSDHICNASDDGGRYSYSKQPEICKWNCLKFGEAIQEALPISISTKEVDIFDEEFKKHYIAKMRLKLGLLHHKDDNDETLVDSLLTAMEETGADFTNTFRCLSQIPYPGSPNFKESLKKTKDYIRNQCCSADELKKSLQPKMDARELQMLMFLVQMNPQLVEQLGRLGSFRKELEKRERLENIKDLNNELKNNQDDKVWQVWLDKYIERLKKESEGTANLTSLNRIRVETMNSNNPRFVLRNYIAQTAIEEAEKGNFSEVQRVLRLLENPYSDNIDLGNLSVLPEGATAGSSTQDEYGTFLTETLATSVSTTCPAFRYDGKPPEWAHDLRVT